MHFISEQKLTTPELRQQLKLKVSVVSEDWFICQGHMVVRIFEVQFNLIPPIVLRGNAKIRRNICNHYTEWMG